MPSSYTLRQGALQTCTWGYTHSAARGARTPHTLVDVRRNLTASMSASPSSAPVDATSLLLPGQSPVRSEIPQIGLSRRRPHSYRVHAHQPHAQVSLSSFALSDDDDDDGDDDNAEAASLLCGKRTREHEPAEEHGSPGSKFESSRKRVKRTKCKVARPRDSMPGYRKRPRGVRGDRSSRFPRNTPSNVGKKYLDRGLSAGAYYGRGAVLEDDGVAASAYDEEANTSEAPDMHDAEAERVPLCNVHRRPCVKVQCKRGANKGRMFLKCSQPKRYERCNFFAWADEASLCPTPDEAILAKSSELFSVSPAVIDREGDGSDIDVDRILRDRFGHTSFKDGQENALRRLLEGKSTLAVLPTGGGKSLIYQMFAAMRPGIVLVVTPLVSLMRDQMMLMPDFLPSACLRSGQSGAVVADTEAQIRAGKVKVLFVSPERLYTRRFQSLVSSHSASMFSLVVLDEAHCISEWSHNFRTSYLRLPRLFFASDANAGERKEDLLFDNPPLFLALTATATDKTVHSICDSLQLDVHSAVVRASVKRSNMKLGVTYVAGSFEEKLDSLVRYLQTEPLHSIIHEEADEEQLQKQSKDESDEWVEGWGASAKALRKKTRAQRTRKSRRGCVIVYVSKQRTCEVVCNYLQTSSLRFSRKVATYHAGMSQFDREKTQKAFEDGCICLLIATVAFGMGLNSPNARAIIHLEMPFSLESYSQEIGRAGRFGDTATCHAFSTNADERRLLSRCHSDGVDVSSVRQFIRTLLDSKRELMQREVRDWLRRYKHIVAEDVEEAADGGTSKCSVCGEGAGVLCNSCSVRGEEALLQVSHDKLQRELDMRNETGETICAMLEREVHSIHLMSGANTSVCVEFFSKSPEHLLGDVDYRLAPNERLFVELLTRHAKLKYGKYELRLGDAGLTEEDILSTLYNLSNAGHIRYELQCSALRVRCSTKAVHELEAKAALLASSIANNLARIERIRVAKAHAVLQTFRSADNALSAEAQSSFLHNSLEEYFAEDSSLGVNVPDLAPSPGEYCSRVRQEVEKDVRALLCHASQGGKEVRTPRQIARILHGIGSAAFPAKAWYSCQQWAKLINIDFTTVKQIAAELIRHRAKGTGK